MVAAALLTMLGVSQAFGQSEPIPGYFELQVAYCWGMYDAMIPENKALLDQACAADFKATATYNCQSITNSDAVWQDHTDALRNYLLTGTSDNGANTGVAIAITRGRQFVKDLFNASSDLTTQEVKDRSAECVNVIKELPY